MSRPIALLISGIFTLSLLAVIGLITLWKPATPAADPAGESVALPSAEDAQAVYQASVEEAQAAMAEREALYQTRQAELEQMAGEREAEYQARSSEAEVQLVTYQSQIDQLVEAAAAAQNQIPQLEQALQERYTLFESQRQEFETQRQAQLGQLQAQIIEGKVKLQEANAQLGR